MTKFSRFSTSTIVASNGIVPWLAAQGPLAYSPVEPPAGDYFFQYSWILPGIFDPKVNLREHRYFGNYCKDSAKFLFDFWGNARQGRGAALQQYCEPGLFSDVEVKIINPSRVSLVEAVGCQVEFIPPAERTTT